MALRRHNMLTPSALLAPWSPVEFPHQSFDVPIIVSLNKLLNKQYSCERTETIQRSRDITTLAFHSDPYKWMNIYSSFFRHGSLTRYTKLRVARAPGMPGTFSPPPRVSDPDIHHGTCVTHVPWCMPGSQTSGFLWTAGKTFPAFSAHAQPAIVRIL